MEMITIIIMWILLLLIAIIVILLHFSVYAYVRLDNDGFFVKVKYLFFNIYPRKKKPKKVKKRKNATKIINGEKDSNNDVKDNLDDDFKQEHFAEAVKKDVAIETITENSENKVTEAEYEAKVATKIKKQTADKNEIKADKNSKWQEIKEKYYKIKPYLPMGWKYFKKLLKAIRITDLRINIDVGREDAHEAVIYYGTVQGALFNTLAVLANVFEMKIKKADVNCIFSKNIADGNGECYIRVRPSTVIAIAVCVAINFLIVYCKQKKINNQQNTETEK